jgi:hypothetical protein
MASVQDPLSIFFTFLNVGEVLNLADVALLKHQFFTNFCTPILDAVESFKT